MSVPYLAEGEVTPKVKRRGFSLKKLGHELFEDAHDGVRGLIRELTPDRYTLDNHLPVIKRAKEYNKEKLLRDFIAGATVGLMVVPQGLSYAKLANLPVQYGLYSSYIGLLIYMVLGTSNVISIGPVAVLSLLVGNTITKGVNGPEKAIALTFLTGIIQFILGFTRVGKLVHLLSNAVIKGFTTASAVIIICTQIPPILGLRKTKSGGSFSRTAYGALSETRLAIDMTTKEDAVMSLICILVLFALSMLPRITDRHVKQKLHRDLVSVFSSCRHFLVVIIAAGICYNNKDLQSKVKLTDPVPKGMPTAAAPVLHDFTALLSEALPIAFIGYIEHYSISMQFANLKGAESDIHPNQEWMTLGVMNIVGSFFSAYPVTGSFSRSSVKARAGVRTPFCGFWTALIVIFALTVLTPAFTYIPSAALASVIAMSVVELIALKTLWRLFRVDKKECLVMALVIVFGIWQDVEIGLAVGVGVTLFFFLNEQMNPRKRSYYCEMLDGDGAPVHVVKLVSAVHYTCIDSFEKHCATLMRAQQLMLIVDCSECAHMDFGFSECIWQLYSKMKSRGFALCLASCNKDIKQRLLKLAPDDVNEEDVFFNTITHALGGKTYSKLVPIDHTDIDSFTFLGSMVDVGSASPNTATAEVSLL